MREMKKSGLTPTVAAFLLWSNTLPDTYEMDGWTRGNQRMMNGPLAHSTD